MVAVKKPSNHTDYLKKIGNKFTTFADALKTFIFYVGPFNCCIIMLFFVLVLSVSVKINNQMQLFNEEFVQDQDYVRNYILKTAYDDDKQFDATLKNVVDLYKNQNIEINGKTPSLVKDLNNAWYYTDKNSFIAAKDVVQTFIGGVLVPIMPTWADIKKFWNTPWGSETVNSFQDAKQVCFQKYLFEQSNSTTEAPQSNGYLINFNIMEKIAGKTKIVVTPSKPEDYIVSTNAELNNTFSAIITENCSTTYLKDLDAILAKNQDFQTMARNVLKQNNKSNIFIPYGAVNGSGFYVDYDCGYITCGVVEIKYVAAPGSFN